MKKGFMVAALAVTTAIAVAQEPTVDFTKVLDINTAAGTAASVRGATYVPGSDVFIASRNAGPTNIFNAETGAYEGNLSHGSLTPGGSLGLFALTATEDGVIYGYNNVTGGQIWRWADIESNPEVVYEGVPMFRMGYTGKVGEDISIAFTGLSDGGNVDFFSDTFPFSSESFTFNEAIDLNSKSGLAMNNDATAIFTVTTTGAMPIDKWEKVDGTWSASPVWTIPGTRGGGGAMAYDNTHDILFVLPTGGTAGTRLLSAYSGATGAVLGTVAVDNVTLGANTNVGGYAAPSANGGRVHLIGIGASNTVSMYTYDYTVSGASVDDWSLYQN